MDNFKKIKFYDLNIFIYIFIIINIFLFLRVNKLLLMKISENIIYISKDSEKLTDFRILFIYLFKIQKGKCTNFEIFN